MYCVGRLLFNLSGNVLFEAFLCMWRCSEELHVVYRQLGISVHMQPQWLEKQLRTVSLCQYLSVKECCLCVGGGGGCWCWGAPTTYMKRKWCAPFMVHQWCETCRKKKHSRNLIKVLFENNFVDNNIVVISELYPWPMVLCVMCMTPPA